MNENGRYRELEARVRDERARLESVRADYEVIMRSRFHALRMLWFSLKQLFGISSSSDVYAAWSSGIEPSLTGGRRQRGNGKRHDVAPTAALSEEETALIAAWNDRVAARPMSETPLVTVVVPFYDRRDLTVRCLQSIADSWFESLDVQFVLVDDGSVDQSGCVAMRLDGVEYVRSAKNEGFVRACNRGAALARGKYLCFLNNDTIVRDGWLDYLVMTLEHDASIGVAGSKLVFPDGRLQEAGSILWCDATGWNAGRNEHADDPRYNYLRDVDYVSGAALAVRTELFARLGGFSEALRPAYYEDADLCFGVRASGYRVVYQPRSVVVHEDGGSSTDDSGAKRFQEINRPKFHEKWKAELDRHLENSRANVTAAMRRYCKGPQVLVIDSYVPLYDKEAGSLRLLHIVKMLRQAGYGVTFFPDNYAPLQPYTGELQQLGVEVLHHFDGGRTPQESLEQVLPSIDVAWISRTELFDKYEPLLRRNPNVRIIYDTVDLNHVRKRRKAEVHGESDALWQELQRQEASAARRADATIAVTPDEESVLRELGAREVFVVPTIHEPRVSGDRSFGASSGLLFIGNYHHPPNVDAVSWLCKEIMPIVWRSLPDVRLTLLGSNPPAEVNALAADRVEVTGYVRDVEPHFVRSRVFVAPLRFGAGMKGKIGQALEYALPVVTTPVGAEGLNLRDGGNASIAAPEPQAFAQAIVALYGDRDRWQRYSNAAAKTLEPFTPEWVRPRLLDIFDRVRSLTAT